MTHEAREEQTQWATRGTRKAFKEESQGFQMQLKVKEDKGRPHMGRLTQDGAGGHQWLVSQPGSSHWSP